ncbi:MAG: inorganic phosphate transporter [Staphylothermus sp.]|nr:inorganic phosphate transporter [Staphylothermus sp.]
MIGWYWLVIGGVAAFLVAWINGANNAANAIGTAVGAKALDVKKALMLAATFDFLGAIIYGRFISMTLLKGIVDTSSISDAYIIVVGMVSALFATGIWVLIATIFKIPISISQAMVGGMTGFGIVVLGSQAINWAKITEIIASWIYLPFLSAFLALSFYKLFMRIISELTRIRLLIASSLLYFIVVFVTVFLLNIKTSSVSDMLLSIFYSVLISILFTIPFIIYFKLRVPSDINKAKKHVFRLLLIVSAAAMAFSHGACDAANSAGPFTGIMFAVTEGYIPSKVTIPLTSLLLSASGIASGILIWGYRVIETIGENITILNIETAFVAQFGGSIAVLIIARMGLPVSTTVSIVGAVAGVGIAKGIKAVNLKLLSRIIVTWFLGFPFVAGLTGLLVHFLI